MWKPWYVVPISISPYQLTTSNKRLALLFALAASSAVALAAICAAGFAKPAEAKTCGGGQFCECYYGSAKPFVRCAAHGQHTGKFTFCGTDAGNGCEATYLTTIMVYNYSKCIPVGAYNGRHKCRDG